MGIIVEIRSRRDQGHVGPHQTDGEKEGAVFVRLQDFDGLVRRFDVRLLRAVAIALDDVERAAEAEVVMAVRVLVQFLVGEVLPGALGHPLGSLAIEAFGP